MKQLTYIPILFFFILISCEEETVDPIVYGSIEGQVIEKSTQEPIVDARISTNPVSETVYSDENGMFMLENVPGGDVTVEANKSGYLTRFDAVSVTQNTTTDVILDMEIETANNRPPLAPMLISPANDSIGLPLEVELLWNAAIDEEQDPVRYTLSFFEEGSSDIQEFTELTDTTFVVSDLEFNTRYYWQVSAQDDINDEKSTSEIFSFLTTPFPLNRVFFTRELNGNNVIYSSSDKPDSLTMLQITSPNNNSWRPRQNPTVDLVAFLRNVGTETHIFTMRPDGTELTQVTDIPIAGFREDQIDFTWTHDGEKLLYPYFDKLYSINKDGSGIELMYTQPDGKLITEADWSSDGSFFALKVNNEDGYENEIYTVDMAGNRLQTILSGVPGAAGGLNISFNMETIIYTHDVSEFENDNYRQLDSHVFLYNLNDDSIVDLSEDKENGFNDLDPRFSPNEAKVIVTNTSNDGVSTKSLYIIDVESVGRELLIEDAFMPDWE